MQQDCGDPDWFRWRIKVERPFDFWENEVSSACNTGNTDIEEVTNENPIIRFDRICIISSFQVQVHEIGVRNELANWDMDELVFTEVRHGIEFGAEQAGLSAINYLNDATLNYIIKPNC